jgi:hypothetical protein
MGQALTISKLDAAKRQLETAIRLYFHQGDPVSIHTLVSAAYNIIRDINKKRGGAKMLVKEQLFDQVRPEMRSEFHELLHKAENFFKHADRDHDASLEFSPNESEFLVWDACTKYWELTGEQPPLFQVYRGWFMATHQNVFNLSEEMQRKLAEASRGTTEDGRMGFFNLMLPSVMKSGV